MRLLLTFNDEGRPASWQNAQSSPNQSASYLYDGAGQRVQQVATMSGATTTTGYIGSLEEVTSSGGTTTTTAYYGGLAESVNGALSYVLSDVLGSATASVSTATGAVTATQLYGPYGAVRYQQGTLPTSKGYTGQRADTSTSGLDYYGARYYDAVAGQFTSADTTLAGGLNEYAYVAGNPESRTDPTGHALTCPAGGCGGGSSPSGASGGGSDSRRPATGSGSLPKGCNYTGYRCQIESAFHDQRTRDVLEFIANAGSKVGLELLQYLLFVAAHVGGDILITWKTAAQISREVGRASTADTDAGSGYISLSVGLLGDDSREVASALIHEATESYFVIEKGMHFGEMGTQRGDYVAQWFAGEFESQARNSYGVNIYPPDNGPASDLSTQNQHYLAYGLSFDQWQKTGDFAGANGKGGYSDEGSITWQRLLPHVPGMSGTQWVGLYEIPDLNNKLGDLMSL